MACMCEACVRGAVAKVRAASILAATPGLATGTAPGNERSPLAEPAWTGMAIASDVRPTSDKPCCKRIGAARRWCVLDDGHAGACDGPAERVPDDAQFYTRVGGGR